MPTMSPSSAVIISAIPVLAAVLLYRLETFDPAPLPEHELTQKGAPFFAPKRNSQLLRGSERIGFGELPGPEDLAYDPKTGVVFTGCEDGWIRRVTLNASAADTAVKKWVNTGGRPLGIAHGLHGEVIVADAHKGLLNISKDGTIKLLTDEADGLKFKLTNSVDIAGDGTLYFTDTSYKYSVDDGVLDFLEGRPHGRLLSYHPSTEQTRVLLTDLYFANGVAVSPDQTFVVVCETPLRRCKRYYIEGPRRGSADVFIENLPGMPDNIKYDGDGLFWIALFTESTSFELLLKYPSIRKVSGMIVKYAKLPSIEKNGGTIAVDLEGKPSAYYHDVGASKISGAIKIGEHLLMGSVSHPYIIRLNILHYPAS